MSNPLPAGTELGRTALRVEHSNAVADFYRDVVGPSVPDSGEHTIFGAGETPLLVLLEDESDQNQTAPGLFHTAFRVPTRAALGAALARIRDRWQLEGASDHGVSEALSLSDPEGNGVEIYVDRPRERWLRTNDGIDIYTERLDIDSVAAAADGADAAPPDTDIGHVHLEVTLLDTVEQFYAERLGFDLQASVRGARFLGAGGYHHHIGANTWQGRTGRAGGRGLAWFEILLPDCGSLSVVRERLDDVTATDAGFSVRDPDDIEIRFRAER